MEEKPLDGQLSISSQGLAILHDRLMELYENNLNLRMKYSTQPQRFYPTQEQIDNILYKLQAITQESLPIVVQSNILTPILKILNHPNIDINMRCVQFLDELITQQPTQDNLYEIYYRLNIWMIENGLFESLVQILFKLKEQQSVEQYQIGLKILKMIEMLLQLWQKSIQNLHEQTKILDYLANRIMPNYIIKHKVMDDNKFVSSDILITILSYSSKAQQKFHALYGMQILLESIKPYLSKKPTVNDEEEYLNNLFGCLNILLINTSKELLKSRKIYHEMKGNAIMMQFITTKSKLAISALKAISNAFTSLSFQEENQVIQQLIQNGALKYIFPIILRKGLKGQDVDQQKTIDQNCLNIVYKMIRCDNQISKLRVQAKLTQKRFEKLQKMFEIRNQYMQDIGNKDINTQISLQAYLQKIGQGLGIIQIIDRIITYLIKSNTTIRQKIIVFMRLYAITGKDLQYSLKTLYKFIENDNQKQFLEKLISNNLLQIFQLFYKENPIIDKQKQQINQ